MLESMTNKYARRLSKMCSRSINVQLSDPKWLASHRAIDTHGSLGGLSTIVPGRIKYPGSVDFRVYRIDMYAFSRLANKVCYEVS